MGIKGLGIGDWGLGIGDQESRKSNYDAAISSKSRLRFRNDRLEKNHRGAAQGNREPIGRQGVTARLRETNAAG